MDIWLVAGQLTWNFGFRGLKAFHPNLTLFLYNLNPLEVGFSSWAVFNITEPFLLQCTVPFSKAFLKNRSSSNVTHCVSGRCGRSSLGRTTCGSWPTPSAGPPWPRSWSGRCSTWLKAVGWTARGRRSSSSAAFPSSRWRLWHGKGGCRRRPRTLRRLTTGTEHFKVRTL